VLESELLYGETFELTKEAESPDFVLPIGKAHVQRAGADITIVAHGRSVGISMAAAEELAGEGIEAEVINLRSIRPLDSETIMKSLAKTGYLVTVEEGYPQCGVGAEICARVMEEGFDLLDAPVERITSADVPMPYSPKLEEYAMVHPHNVVNVVKRVLNI
jgi:pyruvate dehydrogenase E1 component beta subunit